MSSLCAAAHHRVSSPPLPAAPGAWCIVLSSLGGILWWIKLTERIGALALPVVRQTWFNLNLRCEIKTSCGLSLNFCAEKKSPKYHKLDYSRDSACASMYVLYLRAACHSYFINSTWRDVWIHPCFFWANAVCSVVDVCAGELLAPVWGNLSVDVIRLVWIILWLLEARPRPDQTRTHTHSLADR